MKPISGDIEQIKAGIERLRKLQSDTQANQRKTIKCLRCGANIHFFPRQYQIKHTCGNVVTRRDYINQVSDTHCQWCDDKGYIIYPTQLENSYIERSAQCVCEAGDKIEARKLPKIINVADAPVDLVQRVIFDMTEPEKAV